MSKKLPSISPGNGTIRKKWLDEPLVKERLLEAQRGGRSFIIDHILENFDHYPDEVDIIRQHFAKHQGDNSNEAFDAIMDKIFGSISIERLSEIEIEAAYYLGGELGIHPGPFTERQLVQMADGKRRSQKRQAELIVEALKVKHKQQGADKGGRPTKYDEHAKVAVEMITENPIVEHFDIEKEMKNRLLQMPKTESQYKSMWQSIRKKPAWKEVKEKKTGI